MIKKSICVVVLLAFLFDAKSQMKFEENKKFKDVLLQAQREKKMVFIDFYTSWCGPCKEMDKNTFTNKDVGDFFNNRYISVKIDAEKGEGPLLGKKYGANAYPTLVFLDSLGRLIHKKVGALEPLPFIEAAKVSLSKEVVLLRKKNELFESGKMPATELLDYLKMLSTVEMDCVPALNAYIKTIKTEKLITPEVYALISRYTKSVYDEPFQILVKNYQAFSKITDKAEFDLLLYRRYIFDSYYNFKYNRSNDSMYAAMEGAGLEFAHAVKENNELVNILKDRINDNEFTKRADVLIAKYPIAYLSLINEALKKITIAPVIETYLHELVDRMAISQKWNSSRIAAGIATQYYVNAQNKEMALKYFIKSNDWAKEKDYMKSTIELCQRELGLIKCLKYGQVAPNFVLPDLNGKKVSLADFKGKYILLDFWASWCGPCKVELPYLKAINEKYKDAGLVVLSITADKKDNEWKNAVEKEEMNWLHVSAKNTDVLDKYDAQGIPRIVLIDKEGKIIADELRGNVIEKEVSKAFLK